MPLLLPLAVAAVARIGPSGPVHAGLRLNPARHPRADDLYAAGTTNEGRTAIYRVTMDGRASVLLELHPLSLFDLSLSPDGRHLAFVALTTDSNVWLLENI